jgi:protein phosphatase
MLDVQFGQASDFGKVRTNNEDSMGSFVPQSRKQGRSHGFLFAVADGVGGLDLGEIASATAVETLAREFAKAQPGEMLANLLPKLIEQANIAVHNRTISPEYRGKKMATTLVACALRYDQLVVSHVGDSRCFMVRNGQTRLLTQDHTWVNEQRKLGLLTAEEAATSDSRHILIRSLGPEMFVSPDTSTHTLLPGDTLILCSDGLHDELPEEEMARIVSQNKPMDAVAKELVARAVELDGGDNTTAIVARVRDVEKVGMYRGRPYRLPA